MSVTEIHRIVFQGDFPQALQQALDKDDGALRKNLNNQDVRGNTALHLAAMLGRRQCVEVLLQSGASLLIKNNHGSHPLHEARSFGDRDLIRTMMKARRLETRDYFLKRSENITKQLTELDDFYMEMKWEFSSWIPLLSRFCPNDTLKIRKKGACMRVDTTLVGFEGITWLRGNLSYMFNPDAHGRELTIVDYDKKIYEHVDGEEHDEKKIEERINVLLNLPVRYGELQTEDLAFARVRSGLLGFGSGKSERVGEYDADLYTVENVKLKTVSRAEHLDPKLVPKNSPQKSESSSNLSRTESSASTSTSTSAVSSNTENGTNKDKENNLSELLEDNANLDDDNPKAREELLRKLDGKKEDDVNTFVQNARKNAIKFKPSLKPPEPTTVKEDVYFNPPGVKEGTTAPYLHLGRPMTVSNSARKMRATLWMSNSFPLFVEQLFPLMEIMSPSNEHFAHLRDFIDLKLPRGFPIKIEIPLFGILTARVTFQSYRIDNSFEQSLFEVPEGFNQGEIKFFNN